MDAKTRRTWAEIDLTALEYNYRALRALTAPTTKFLGVVKADAYGHGALPVAHRLEELGCDYLAVACLDEAIALREDGIGLPILILGVTPPEFAQELADRQITQAVGDLELGKAYAAHLTGDKPLHIHVKVDTGMSRLGFLATDPTTPAQIQELRGLPGLYVEGIFTHFANADGDEAYTMTQFTRFLDLLDALKKEGVAFPIRHCAASAAVLNYPCTHLDMIRPGIALYGHYPAPDMEHTCPLYPVMSLKARVAAVRELRKGTPVSYGCTAVLEEDATLAVLPVGYADGFHRLLSNRGVVFIQGHPCPIVGRVCMDLCMVKVDKSWGVKPGDEAVIFDAQHPLEDLADLAGTIQYELLCAVAPRAPRLYR